jgi:hypothetical protein
MKKLTVVMALNLAAVGVLLACHGIIMTTANPLNTPVCTTNNNSVTCISAYYTPAIVNCGLT